MKTSEPITSTAWHPSHEILRDFCSGKIFDSQLHRSVEDHLQDCSTCGSQIQQFEADHLEQQLQGLQLDERLIGPAPQHYELIEEIGRGGAGVVYLARQAGLDRPVAVKMLLSGRRSGRSQLARFRRESAALARLTHPNVVQVYDCGELDGAPFLAMEYIDGPSLAERLRRGPLEVTQAARWIKALADAVAFAHESGILHRDLKPQNVLLASNRVSDPPDRRRCDTRQDVAPTTPDESQTDKQSAASVDSQWIPKLVDFGLAHCQDVTQFQTATGETLGTPVYMAPEAIDGKASANGQQSLDIYGLGAILYECLTGRPPFTGSSTWEILDAVANQEPVSITSMRAGVPRDLVTICARCMDKRPDRRFSSARELVDDLQRFIDGRPILSRRISLAEKTLRWARRRPAVAAAGLLGLTLVTAIPLLLAAQNRAVQQERNVARSQYAETRAALHEILGELKKDNAELTPEATRLADRQSQHAVKLFERLAEVDDTSQSLLELAKVLMQNATIKIVMGDYDSARVALDQAEAGFRQAESDAELRVASLEGLFQVSTKRAILLQNLQDWEAVDEQLIAAEGYLLTLQDLTDGSDQTATRDRLRNKQFLYQAKGNRSLRQKDYSQAKTDYEQSLNALEGLREMSAYGADEQRTAAGVRINLANTEMQLQELELSAVNYRMALEDLETWAAQHAENPSWIEEWSAGILNQSSVLVALDRKEEAFHTLSDARAKLHKALFQDSGRFVPKNILFMVTANRAMFCPFPERKIECWRDALSDATDRNHAIFARQMLVRVLALESEPQSAQSELLQVDVDHLDDQQRFVQASCQALICKSCRQAENQAEWSHLEPLAKKASDESWKFLQGLATDGLLNEVRIEHLKTSNDWDAIRESVPQHEWEQLIGPSGS